MTFKGLEGSLKLLGDTALRIKDQRDRLMALIDGPLTNSMLGMIEDGNDETLWNSAKIFMDARDALIDEINQ